MSLRERNIFSEKPLSEAASSKTKKEQPQSPEASLAQNILEFRQLTIDTFSQLFLQSELSKSKVELFNAYCDVLEEILASQPEKFQEITQALKEYWAFMAQKEKEAEEEVKEMKQKTNVSRRSQDSLLADRDMAREHIQKIISLGIPPIITIEKENWEKIQKEEGIRDWETKGGKIVGTLGAPPYRWLEQDRVAVMVLDPNPQDWEPRLGGPYQVFKGTVYYKGSYLPLSKLKVIEIKKSAS